jgi:hypothetical protein
MAMERFMIDGCVVLPSPSKGESTYVVVEEEQENNTRPPSAIDRTIHIVRFWDSYQERDDERTVSHTSEAPQKTLA